MTEQSETMSEITEHTDKAFHSMSDAANNLVQLGINPAALATALGLVYVNFVSTFAAASGQTKEIGFTTMQNAIGAMEDYASECFDRATARIEKGDE